MVGPDLILHCVGWDVGLEELSRIEAPPPKIARLSGFVLSTIFTLSFGLPSCTTRKDSTDE